MQSEQVMETIALKDERRGYYYLYCHNKGLNCTECECKKTTYDWYKPQCERKEQ